MRGPRRWDEENAIEMESPLGCLRYGHMTGVNRIEGTAK
jgi:hypothetical protein